MANEPQDQAFALPDDILNDPNITEEEKQLIISGQEIPSDDDDDDNDEDNSPPPEEKPAEKPVDSAIKGDVAAQADNPDTETQVVETDGTTQVEPAQATSTQQQTEDPLASLNKQFEDAATQKDALEAEKQQLVEQYKKLGEDFDEGSIGEGKYRSGLFEIQEKINGINGQLAAVTQHATEIKQQAQDIHNKQADSFGQACNAFFARPENTAFVEGSPAWQVLDAQVRVLQTSFPNMPATELLDKARAAAATIVNLPPVKDAPSAGQQSATQQKNKPADLPPSIGDMTSAETNQAGGGEFDYLFKLKGSAFDDAVAKLNDDQFMRAQAQLQRSKN